MSKLLEALSQVLDADKLQVTRQAWDPVAVGTGKVTVLIEAQGIKILLEMEYSGRLSDEDLKEVCGIPQIHRPVRYEGENAVIVKADNEFADIICYTKHGEVTAKLYNVPVYKLSRIGVDLKAYELFHQGMEALQIQKLDMLREAAEQAGIKFEDARYLLEKIKDIETRESMP